MLKHLLSRMAEEFEEHFTNDIIALMHRAQNDFLEKYSKHEWVIDFKTLCGPWLVVLLTEYSISHLNVPLYFVYKLYININTRKKSKQWYVFCLLGWPFFNRKKIIHNFQCTSFHRRKNSKLLRHFYSTLSKFNLLPSKCKHSQVCKENA